MPTPSTKPPLKRLSYTGILRIIFILSSFTPVTSYSTKTSFFKDSDNLPVQFISKQNTLIDNAGTEISLENLLPHNRLFSTETFSSVDNGKAVVHQRTKDVLGISVFRGEHTDGSTVLLSKNGNGDIDYVIVSGRDGQDSTHFIQIEEEPGAFLTVGEADYDYNLIAEMFDMGVGLESPSDKPSMKNPSRPSSKSKKNLESSGGRNNRLRAQEFDYVNGDGTSKECDSFLVIPVSIFFDAEFCQLYSGKLLTAVSAVQIIVAAASLHYENNLCSRLELTGINWDTTSCNPENSIFKDFNRERCGTYLSHITEYMEEERDGLGIDSASWVHLFTGLPISDNLGCAWLPGPCFSEFVYGVNYMSFMIPDVRGQAFILAHELGHNFNAPHDPSSPEPPNYIMEARFNNATDGFSESSAEKIVESLVDPLNFCVAREPVEKPTTVPIARPTISSTELPTGNPTSTPSLRPMAAATIVPSILPTMETVIPPSIVPTSLPTVFPTQSQTSTSPTKFLTTALPTPGPSFPPPTSARPTTMAPTMQPVLPAPTPLPATDPPIDECQLGRLLVDPVCIDANDNSDSDYTCYDKDDLLVFSASTDACMDRVELTIDSCDDAFLPIPGSRRADDGSARIEQREEKAQGQRRLLDAFAHEYDHDSIDDKNLRREQLNMPWFNTYRPLPTSRGKTTRARTGNRKMPPLFDWSTFNPFQKQVEEEPPPLPFCSESCSEVAILNQVCFRSTALPAFDRWFRVRYTATDPFTRSTQVATVFVVVKSQGQKECSSDAVATCREDDDFVVESRTVIAEQERERNQDANSRSDTPTRGGLGVSVDKIIHFIT